MSVFRKLLLLVVIVISHLFSATKNQLLWDNDGGIFWACVP